MKQIQKKLNILSNNGKYKGFNLKGWKKEEKMADNSNRFIKKTMIKEKIVEGKVIIKKLILTMLPPILITTYYIII